MSPIRPENRKRYPSNWKQISAQIRARAGGQCECAGECGLHQPKVTTDYLLERRCEERDGQPAVWAMGGVRLTVAHLDHTPENCDPANLKAMCQRCHLRYDREHHAKSRIENRLKASGQRSLFGGTDGNT